MTITALKALQLRNHGQTIVKVETDEGVVGLGEAGAPGPVVRANIKDYFEPLLIGQDPLCIDRLYTVMTRDRSQWQARYVHMPTVSGIDIALWDIAGKVFKRPVSELLTGRYRDSVSLYVNTGGPDDWRDKAGWRDWAAQEKASRYGWKTLKLGFERAVGNLLPEDRYRGGTPSMMLTQTELAAVRRGYESCRDALGWDTDLIVHCHNEWDLPTALGLAEAVAPAKPLWVEDAMPVMYSDTWRVLRESSPVRIMTGEKLELASEFLPFIVNGGAHVLHPDLCYAGGITGCRRVADLAEMYYIPVVLHCVGSLVQLLAGAHFGASVRNFVMSECRIPAGDLFDEMSADGIRVRGGSLEVPRTPGLGITLVPEVLRDNRLPGEPWWD
jgi:L-alanine-DL-glutamate epimerase-like enolase superfamily enzyme